MAQKDKQQANIPSSSSVHGLIKRAGEIYDGLRAQLEPAQIGRYVAIEVESGEHFLGDTREEAVKASKTKYPDRITFTRKIGETEKAARRFLHQSSRHTYVRTF